jgi:hypothetical protein
MNFVRGSEAMPRYFFDIREGNYLAVDEEGVELPDVQAAEAEAARSLTDMARDHVLARTSHSLTIDVRDDNGPIARAKLSWDLQKH